MTDVVAYNIGSFQWVTNFLLFIIAVLTSWTIPGSILVNRLNISATSRIVVSTILGMVLWTWQGIIFGYLQLRFLSYIYLGIGITYWVVTKQYRYLPSSINVNQLKEKRLFILLGITGVIMLQIPLFINGLETQNGILFCCTSDTFWYLSLIDILINRFPPDVPGMNGFPLTNYHYFFNISVAELVRVFHLPLIPTLFHYIRLLYAVLYTFIGYIFIASVTRNKVSQLLFFFLLFFATDLYYVIIFIYSGTITFDYTPIYISQKILFNMPMAGATILLFTTLYLISLPAKTNKTALCLITAIITGSIIGYKAHTGIAIIIGLGIVSFYDIVKTRSFFTSIIFILSVAISLVAFLPVNTGTGGLYPSWFYIIEEGMKGPLKFNKETLEWISYLTKKRRLFSVQLSTFVTIILYEIQFFITYLVSVFGCTLLGMRVLLPYNRLIDRRNVVLFASIIVISIILGTFFLQKTGGGHTYNFLIVAFLLLIFLTSVLIGSWLKKLRNTALITVVISLFITLNILPTVVTVNTFITEMISNKIFILSWDEINAANYLAKQDFNYGYLVVDDERDQNYITPYLSYFVQQPLYYSGEYILSALNLPYQRRAGIVQDLKEEQDASKVFSLVKQEKIRYIYVKTPAVWTTLRTNRQVFKEVYKNNTVTVLAPVNIN